jgi:hypothetical protein
MADGLHHDNSMPSVKLADYAIVTHAVTPQTELGVAQRLAEILWVAGGDMPIHVVEDFRRNCAVELLYL